MGPADARRALGKWSPAVEFPIALAYVLTGGRIARRGWRGFVQLVPGEVDGAREVAPSLLRVQPDLVGGWLPTREDLFARDWMCLPHLTGSDYLA